MPSPLTEQEKERCRYHLGYLGTSFGGETAAASMAFGVPQPIQTVFLMEEAIQNLLTNPHAVERVRSILCTLDQLEDKLRNAACQLAVESVGDLKLRSSKAGETYPDLLEREYVRWANRLADVLGVPLYPFAKRFKNSTGIRSVPVRN